MKSSVSARCQTGGRDLPGDGRMVLGGLFHLTKRAIKILVGFAALLIGIVMLVTPGPGLAAIAIGLVLLSTEFQWARRLLHHLKEQGIRIRDSVRGAAR